MKNRKGHGSKGRNIVLIVLVSGVALALLASTGLAQQSGPGTKKTSTQKDTTYDPFLLQTVPASGTTVSGAPVANPPQGAPGVVKNPNPRRDVRIPSRMPLRSAYQPD